MSLLSAALQDEMLPESEKVRIREGLKAHRDVARTMRLGMRQVIEAYANNFIINKSSPGDDTTVVALEAIHRAVERTPLFADEDINEDDDSLQGCKVWLQCQDFAGNFSMPFYRDIRPRRDYYFFIQFRLSGLNQKQKNCIVVCRTWTRQGRRCHVLPPSKALLGSHI